MTLAELKSALVKNEIFFLYGNKLIFVGDETFLQSSYIKKLADITKSKITYADDFLEIKKRLTTNTMMDNSGVFVIKNSTQFIKNEDLFKNLIIPKGKYLILIFDKLDKRKPFYKENLDVICEFEKMTEAQLTKIIKKKFTGLSDTNCATLCSLVGNDYGRLLLEMEKLSIFFYKAEETGYDATSDELFIIALNDGLIYQEISDVSFKLVDDVLARNKKEAFYDVKEIQRAGEDSFKVMALLYSYFKNLLLLKSDRNCNINSFTKSKLNKFLNAYSSGTIINKLSKIQWVEQGIKSGKIDAELALDYLIIELVEGGN